MYCDECTNDTCKECKHINKTFTGSWSYWLDQDKSETGFNKPVFKVGYGNSLSEDIEYREWKYIISPQCLDPLYEAKDLASCGYVSYVAEQTVRSIRDNY